MTFERCSCGAFIVTLRYSRALEWRTSHLHEMPEPEEHGPEGAHSETERAETRYFESVDVPIATARVVGFAPN